MLEPFGLLQQVGQYGPMGQHGPHYGPMGPGSGGMLPWAGGPLWGLLWLVVLLALVAGIVALFRRRTTGDRRPEALAVLERRYASGDIDEAEFETRRERLVGDP